MENIDTDLLVTLYCALLQHSLMQYLCIGSEEKMKDTLCVYW